MGLVYGSASGLDAADVHTLAPHSICLASVNEWKPIQQHWVGREGRKQAWFSRQKCPKYNTLLELCVQRVVVWWVSVDLGSSGIRTFPQNKWHLIALRVKLGRLEMCETVGNMVHWEGGDKWLTAVQCARRRDSVSHYYCRSHHHFLQLSWRSWNRSSVWHLPLEPLVAFTSNCRLHTVAIQEKKSEWRKNFDVKLKHGLHTCYYHREFFSAPIFQCPTVW